MIVAYSFPTLGEELQGCWNMSCPGGGCKAEWALEGDLFPFNWCLGMKLV